MANLSLTALLRLLPFKSGPQMREVLDGLGLSLDRAREYLRTANTEANPRTAVATIDEWLAALNVTAPVGATLGEKQAIAYAAWSSVGGQSLDYINGQIIGPYPNAYIAENTLDVELRMGDAEMGELECEGADLTQLLYYIVAGYVNYARERLTLQGLLSHLVPAHLTEIFQARVAFDGDVARCNIATTGRSICGRSISQYVETQKEIGRCAAGRIGAAITGRTA